MTLELTLTPDLEERLNQEAQRAGLPADEYAVQLLDKQLPPRNRRAELMTLLQTWIDEGKSAKSEQNDDEFLRMIDKDRPSERKLYPPELKGITW